MYKIKECHKVMKNLIKAHFKTINFKMAEETAIEEFYLKLTDLADFVALPEDLKQYCYYYFQGKIKTKNKNKHLSVKKAQKK